MQKAHVFSFADGACVRVIFSGYGLEKHYGKFASAVIAAELLGILTADEADCYLEWPADGIRIEGRLIDESRLIGAEFKRFENV